MDVYPRQQISYPTGNAVDFAVHMRRMGVPTSLISYTGSDDNGRVMLDALTREGLNLSRLHITEGATAVTYMDIRDRERLHGDYVEGVLEHMTFSDDDILFAASHDHVHTAFWGKADPYLERIKRAGPTISFDYATKLNDPLVARTLPYVDYAFFSYPKPRDTYIEQFLKDAAKRGARVAVATFGGRGSLAYDGAAFHDFGVYETEVVNTVGAGDSFIAGFMHGMLQDRPIRDCLDAGARLASQVVSMFEPF